MILVVGLGNPGEKYAKTRHNLGFMVVDKLARDLQFKIDKKANAEIGWLTPEILLAKPQTFMNASGLAVAKLTRRYSLAPDHLLVIHDDVDLPLGKMKIRVGGAAAGHHGVESIIQQLGTDQFVRFRLGIGHPGRGHDAQVEEYVLREFDINETSELKQMLKKAVTAIDLALEKSLQRAMNQFNG